MDSPLEALKHDRSRKTAIALVRIIIGLLRDEERRPAYEEFYRVVRQALDTFESERAKLS